MAGYHWEIEINRFGGKISGNFKASSDNAAQSAVFKKAALNTDLIPKSQQGKVDVQGIITGQTTQGALFLKNTKTGKTYVWTQDFGWRVDTGAERMKQIKNPVMTNANGRELRPIANRGELQVTMGRGNVLIRNPDPLEPFFEEDFSGFHLGKGSTVANPKHKKGKKNPARRPRPYQGRVDAFTENTESRFSNAGREVIPGGLNRGELQLTGGRGNLVIRNPDGPFFEKDFSGFFQTKNGSVVARVNPGARLSVRKAKHQRTTGGSQSGYRITGKDSNGGDVRIFVPTKKMANTIKDILRADMPASVQDKMVGAILTGRKNPLQPFFEDDNSGFFKTGQGRRIANPNTKRGFPFERDLSGRFPDESLGESSAPAAQAGGQFDERLVTAEGGTLQRLVANPHNVELRRNQCPKCDVAMLFGPGVNSSVSCPNCGAGISAP